MQAIIALLTFLTMIAALQIPTPMTPYTSQPSQIPHTTAPATPIIPIPTPTPNDFTIKNISGTRVLDHGEKFLQTTYYTCIALAEETHCGLHAPIIDISAATKLSLNSRKGMMAGIAGILICVMLVM